MADPTAEDLGRWILANQDKAGTPEWKSVADAYDRLTLGQVIDRGPSPERMAGQQFVRNTPYAGSLAALNSAAQGATFGFSDELGGALSAPFLDPLHPVQQYQKGRDALRGVSDQFAQEYPGSNLLANFSGAMLWPKPIAAISKAVTPAAELTRMGRIGTGMTIGGVAGGLGGAGAAENISDIPFEVVKHGAFGAVASPVLQGIWAGGSGVKNAATSLFDIGAGARTAAQRRVAEAISRGGQTAQQAGTIMNQQKFSGEGRILDTSQSTRDLLDTVTNLPGATRDKVAEFLRIRKYGQPERMDALPQALNKGNRAEQTLEFLNQAQGQAAKKAYAAVDNQVVPITPALESLMQRPAFREAFDQAVTNAANRGEQLPLIEDLLKAGPVSGVKVKFWDDVKKGLDDVITAKKRGLSVATPSNANQAQSTLRSSLDIKGELVGEIDRLTGGAYKVARDAYAGPAALKTALEDGTSIWSMSAVEIREALAQMSASEQQAFRIGVGEAIRTKVGSPRGQTELLNAWKDRNTREKLQAIYPTALEYNRALSKIVGEEQLGKAYGIGTGSQTARRLQGSEDLAGGIAEDVAAAGTAVKTGSIPGVLAAVKKFGNRASMPEPVRNEIGKILLKGGAAGKDELAQIEAIVRMYNEQKAGQAAFTGVMAPQLFR